MAERTIVVCDVCGKPATETVTIKVARATTRRISARLT